MAIIDRFHDAATRRRFIDMSWKSALGATSLALLPADDLWAAQIGADPFALGVASGDPKPGGAVLWTRLAPDPLNGGGMPDRAVSVGWRVATDERMRNVVRSGRAMAHPALAHSVHVEVEGLEPERQYHYQFDYRSEESPIGRFKTPAAFGAPLRELNFATLSCQNWAHGYYTVLRDVAEQDLDVVFHLGDYFYETDPRNNHRDVALSDRFAGEVMTLARYRDQHALYKTDPDLQAAHRAHAFVATWDDHEVDNNYAGAAPVRDETSTARFLARRAAAYQAYYEHMPLRRPPAGPDNALKIYRSLRFGDLAEFLVLDTRQYRSDPPCGDGASPRCDAAFDESARMLGLAQERWLRGRLFGGQARWTFLAQSVLMAEIDHEPGPGSRFRNDSWDGFPGARERLLRTIQSSGAANPVILTGDWHSTFVNDIKLDFRRAASATIATEFATPAVCSGGDGRTNGPSYGPMMPANPHVRYFDADRRGYFRMTLTPALLRAELRLADRVQVPNGVVRRAERFAVESGRAGADRAA